MIDSEKETSFSDPRSREHNEPREGSSLDKFLIPVLLFGFFSGFGLCYLWLRTPNLSAEFGDSGQYYAKSETDTGVPNKKTAADKDNAPTSVTLEAGKSVFRRVCQACHQANGLGLAGAFPPLAGSEWVVGDPTLVAAVVLKGLQGEIEVKGSPYNGVMTPFGELLSDLEIASVISYIRKEWGNDATPISETTIAEVRRRLANFPGPIKGQDELKTLLEKVP